MKTKIKIKEKKRIRIPLPRQHSKVKQSAKLYKRNKPKSVAEE